MQGESESPAAFTERIYDMYRQYIPWDPSVEITQPVIAMTFINQAAPDIRKKLYKQEDLGTLSISKFLKIAEKKTFNSRETKEEREEHIRKEDEKWSERKRKEEAEERANEKKRRQRERRKQDEEVLSRFLFASTQGQNVQFRNQKQRTRTPFQKEDSRFPRLRND